MMNVFEMNEYIYENRFVNYNEILKEIKMQNNNVTMIQNVFTKISL